MHKGLEDESPVRDPSVVPCFVCTPDKISVNVTSASSLRDSSTSSAVHPHTRLVRFDPVPRPHALRPLPRRREKTPHRGSPERLTILLHSSLSSFSSRRVSTDAPLGRSNPFGVSVSGSHPHRPFLRPTGLGPLSLPLRLCPEVGCPGFPPSSTPTQDLSRTPASSVPTALRGLLLPLLSPLYRSIRLTVDGRREVGLSRRNTQRSRLDSG